MPSQTIQNYLNDTTVPLANRRNALTDLKGGMQEKDVEGGIKFKYGTKYDISPGSDKPLSEAIPSTGIAQRPGYLESIKGAFTGAQKEGVEQFKEGTKKMGEAKGVQEQLGGAFETMRGIGKGTLGAITGAMGAAIDPLVKPAVDAMEATAGEAGRKLAEVPEARKMAQETVGTTFKLTKEAFEKLPPETQEMLKQGGLLTAETAMNLPVVEGLLKAPKAVAWSGEYAGRLADAAIKESRDARALKMGPPEGPPPAGAPRMEPIKPLEPAVGKEAPPTAIPNGTVLDKLSGAAKDFSPAENVQKAGKVIQTYSKILPSKAEEFAMMSKGKPYGEWLAERGLNDIPELSVPKIWERFQQAKQLLDEGVANTPGKFRSREVWNGLKELESFYEPKPGTPTPRQQLKDYNNVLALEEKIMTDGLTGEEVLEQVKRPLEKDVKTDFMKDNVSAGVRRVNQLVLELRDNLAGELEARGFPQFREISKEIQLSRFMADELGSKLIRGSVNNEWGLIDNMDALSAVMGSPEALMKLGVKKFLNSDMFRVLRAKYYSPEVAKPLPKVEPPEAIPLGGAKPVEPVVEKTKAKTAEPSIGATGKAQSTSISLTTQNDPGPKFTGSSEDVALKDNLEIMYKEAPKAKKTVYDFAEEVSRQHPGSKVQKAPLKRFSRAFEKTKEKYGSDHTQLADVARNTIVTKDYGQIQDVLGTISKDKRVTEVTHVKTGDDPLGYTGGNVKMGTGKISAEIQVQTPDMIYAKNKAEDVINILGKKEYDRLDKLYGKTGGKGHVYYEQYRKLKATSKEAKALAEKSKRYYLGFQTKK